MIMVALAPVAKSTTAVADVLADDGVEGAVQRRDELLDARDRRGRRPGAAHRW